MKSSFFKYKRHAATFIQHLSMPRLINILLSLCEQKIRQVHVSSKPYIARINTTSTCNLRCKGCKGGDRKYPNDSNHMLELIEYKTILDKLAKHLIFVILYDEGEPLLNPSIIDIIRYTQEKNIGSVISSNFSMALSYDFLLNLVNSGLSKLIVALDGMSQEVYGQYRIGGNVNLVKSNLHKFCAIRKNGDRYPTLEIQYLDFGYNHCELEEARCFAGSIGADYFSPINAVLQGWQQFDGKINLRKKMGCSYIWSTIDINNDCSVYPCDYGEDYGMISLGNLLYTSLEDIWNSKKLSSLRRQFKLNTEFLEWQCAQCPKSEWAFWLLR